MSNIDFHYDELTEELHQKDCTRGERMKRSEKARAKRKLIREVNEREHERGYRGDN